MNSPTVRPVHGFSRLMAHTHLNVSRSNRPQFNPNHPTGDSSSATGVVAL